MNSLNSDAAIWSGEADRPLVLLLHGYGSNEADLAGLTPHLPKHYRYVSLRGPIALAGGFAWFPLRMQDGTIVPSGEQAAVEAVANWCRANQLAPVGVVGFSQGGVLALELLRDAALDSLEWAAVLSGFVISPDSATEAEDARDASLAARRPAVFWGRGGRDAVIPAALVAQTLAWLPAHSTSRVELYPELPHSVSLEELADLSEWMLAQA